MNQIDIYKAAIGGRHQNYYLRAFERIEMRDYFSIAIWNWAAFFLGPMWHSYRRVGGVKFTVSSTSLCTILVILAYDLLPAQFGFLVSFCIYCLIFPVPANIYYRYKIDSVVNKHRELSNEDLKKLLVAKLQTTIDQAHRMNGIIK